jgi:hypothetical protein
MSEIIFSIKTLDQTQIEFNPDAIQLVPDTLKVNIREINDDLKTCNVDFEMRDNGHYDTNIYLGLERVVRGTVRMPIALVANVKNADGSINETVANAIFQTFNLVLK